MTEDQRRWRLGMKKIGWRGEWDVESRNLEIKLVSSCLKGTRDLIKFGPLKSISIVQYFKFSPGLCYMIQWFICHHSRPVPTSWHVMQARPMPLTMELNWFGSKFLALLSKWPWNSDFHIISSTFTTIVLFSLLVYQVRYTLLITCSSLNLIYNLSSHIFVSSCHFLINDSFACDEFGATNVNRVLMRILIVLAFIEDFQCR